MNSSKSIKILLVVLALAATCYGERILFLLPLATKSHANVYEPLIRALGERGHEIVSLSPVEAQNMPPTVKQIQLITINDVVGTMPDPFEQRKTGRRITAMFNSSTFDHMNKACVKALKHPKLLELINTEKFDLVVVNVFINHCLLGIVDFFKAPTILVTTMAAPSSISTFVGNRLPPSFVPSIMLRYGDKMSFVERFTNTVLDSLMGFMMNWVVLSKSEEMYRTYLPNGNLLPGIREILSNTSMIFMNSDFNLNYPRPLLPDCVEVGGMHTKPPKKLPEDLDKFLSGAGDEGFIFFSLGSIIKPKEMPESYRKVFVNVFSRLKQRVIWKWDNETMPNLPSNVKLSNWLPQQDVLGHPNIRLFITHGGLLSTQETVYHGVPILGLPVFADQDLNIQQAESGGYAKSLEIIDITEEKLETTILEMLNNNIYAQKAKELSKRVRDAQQEQTPLEKAVFWTEYVLRHKGAKHLRSAARELNFFQYHVLDVTAVLTALVATILYLVIRCCKCACGRICGRRSLHLKRE